MHKGGRRLLRRLVVAERDVARARKLADARVAGRDGLHILIEHGRVVAEHEELHGAALAGVERRPLVTRLRRAEVVQNHRVGQQLLELLLHMLRQHRARRGDHVEVREIILAGVGLEHLREGPRHRVAHQIEHAHRLARDRLQRERRVEAPARRQHHLAARHERNPRGKLCRAVNQRSSRRDARRARVPSHNVCCNFARMAHRVVARATALKTREEDVALAPHDALRHARRAARVDDVEVVIGPLFEVAVALLVRSKIAEPAALHARDRGRRTARIPRLGPDHGGHWRLLRQRAPHLALEVRLREEHRQVAVVHQVLQLLRHIPVVHIDRHRPQLEGREHGNHVFLTVVEVEAEVLTSLEAAVCKGMREPIGLGVELGKGEA